MVSIDPDLPQSSIDSDFIIQLKTTIIKALRGSINDRNYPERKIKGITISMEYPLELERYPHMWVEFSFTKFQQAGIGHMLVDDNGNLQGEWVFEGAARITVMSLTSFERDAYSSQLLDLFAFSKFHPVAAKFDELLLNTSGYELAVDRDTFTPGGQTTNVGVPWDGEALAYQDVYSIRMVGLVQSSFLMPTTKVAGVEVVADGWTGPDPTNLDPGLHISMP